MVQLPEKAFFKTGEAIEAASRIIRTVALDKTGTITAGRPQVTDVVCAEGVDEDYLLSMAYSIEKMPDIPLSLAVNDYCESREVKLVHAGRVQSESGSGLNAVVGETEVFGGRDTYVGRFAVIPDDLKLRARKMAESGRSVMFLRHMTAYLVLSVSLTGFVKIPLPLSEKSKGHGN